MRINQFSPVTEDASTAQVSKASSTTVSPYKKLPTVARSSSSSTEDKTTLSSGSDAVKSLTNTALDSATSRTVKVEALRQAVNKAQYQLDAAKIAEAITNSSI